MNAALRSYKSAVAIGFGAMSADLSYLLLISYGFVHYLQETLLLKILTLLGALFLLYLAYLIFKGRNEGIDSLHKVKELSYVKAYVRGYILTLLNPYTLFFWASVTSFSLTTSSMASTILGMLSAILLWITLMPLLVHKQKALISNKVAYVTAVTSALLLLFFALSLLWNLVRM